MAPERLKGQIDARTDVYALGLTLYELLLFRPALDEYDRGRLIKSIVEAEPARPSTVHRWIPRDLETIVLKAMSKEPEARYATAQELAADLERFLAGKAVAARPIGSLGRAWRWSRRNRVVASLATLLLVVLVTSLGIVTWQWRRAEANLGLADALRVKAEENLVEANEQRDRAEVNFLRARQAVDDYLVTISENTLLEVPTLEPVREELLEKAKNFYKGFVEERTDDPKLKAELAASYIRLGQIEHDLDGDWLPLLTRGLEMVEELADEGVSFTGFRSWREGVYNTRSGYLGTSDVEKFRPIVNRAIAIWEPLIEKHPEVNGFRTDLAGLFLMRGMVHFNVGEYDVAFENFERSRQLREPLVEKYPDVEKYRYALGESYTTCGMVKIRTEKFEEALRYSTKAKELLEPIADANPAATRLADILAAIHQWIALAHLRMNDPVNALSAYQQALNIQERLSREYPYEPHFQLNLALSYRMLGQSMFQAGQVATAKSTYEKSFDLLKQRLKDYPDKTEYRGAIAAAYLDLNGQLYARKKYDEAEQAAKEALDWSDEETPEERSQKSVVHFRLGQALEAQEKFGDAEESYQKAIAIARSTDSIERGWLATYLNYSARNLFRHERFADADLAMKECLEIRRAMPNVSVASIAIGQVFRGRMLEKLDRTDEAAKEFRDAIDIACEQGDPEAAYARDAVNRLVDLFRRTGSPDRAEDLLAELRSRNQDERGVTYGPAWRVQVYEFDEVGEIAEDSPSDWTEVFDATSATSLDLSALDLVWSKEPFAENAPTEHFAIVARCEWDLGSESVELNVHYTDLVRVYVDGELVFQSSSDDDKKKKKRGTVVIAPHEGPVSVRVENIQRDGGLGRLRVWARPVERELSDEKPPDQTATATE